MPSDEYSNDPKMRTAVHAAAKRGHAAMFVQRNTKNCEAFRGFSRLFLGSRGHCVQAVPARGGRIRELDEGAVSGAEKGKVIVKYIKIE